MPGVVIQCTTTITILYIVYLGYATMWFNKAMNISQGYCVSYLAQGEVDVDTVTGLLCIVLGAGQGTFVGLGIGTLLIRRYQAMYGDKRSIVAVEVLDRIQMAQGDDRFC